MSLLTPALRARLRVNADAHHTAQAQACREPDAAPVVKFFNPMGAATWLLSELDADGDTVFGLCDLGFGSPELGYASLLEIAAVRLPHGLRIERDRHFIGRFPLTVYAEAARLTGRITEAETLLATIHRARQPALAKITTADPEIPDISPDPGE